MNKIKRFLKTAATYFAGNILSKLVTFFLIPLYTNKLDPAVYGNYDLVITIVNLLVSVGFFQIWDGMFRYAFDYKDQNDKYRVICDAIVVYAFGIIFYSLLYFIVASALNFGNPIYGFLYGLFFGLQYMYSFMARVFLDNILFVVSGAVNTLTVACLNIVCIIGLKWGAESLYIAQILGCALQVIIIEARLHPLLYFKDYHFSKDAVHVMLRFSIPLCISTVSYWLLSGFTKVVINRTLGSYANGIYAIANSLANIAVIAVNVFQYAWNEMAYLISDNANRKETYSKSINLLIITITFGCAIVCLGIKVLFPILVGEKYASAAYVIPLLLVGVSANSVAGFLGTLFMTEKKTKYILLSTLIAAAINLITAFPAARMFDISGAVLSLTGSFCILMIIRLLQIKKVLNVHFNVKSFLYLFVVTIAYVLYETIDNNIVLIFSAILMALFYLIIIGKMFHINFLTIRSMKK